MDGGGGVVKNRSSAGCLVIKKKPTTNNNNNNKMEPGGGSSSARVERKRSRAATPVSSDEELLEYYRRRGGGGGGHVGAARATPVTAPPVVYRRGIGSHGRSNVELDVYDFDEYDDLSDVDAAGGGARNYYYRHNSSNSNVDRVFGSGGVGVGVGGGGGGGSGGSRFLRPGMGSGGDGDITYKRRSSFGVYRGSEEAIRLQGKNGVLKVMIKKHKKESQSPSVSNVGVRRDGMSMSVTPKNNVGVGVGVGGRPLPYAERRVEKKPVVEGGQVRKRKVVSEKSSEDSDEEEEDEEEGEEDSDASPNVQLRMQSQSQLQLQSRSAEVQRPGKRGRSGESSRSPETPQLTKVKAGKVRRGSGTEKQLLREKIRNMLVSAGWTIDYRPRRGRDYSDAVYVNPSGTAFWSIIKAYDALQKQLEEDGKKVKAVEEGFAPIADDILSKLTRQTRKKIEKELKRKKREESGGKRKKERLSVKYEEHDSDGGSMGSGRNDRRLSAYMKRSVKSVRGETKESYFRDIGSPSSRGQERSAKPLAASSRFVHGRQTKKIGRCTLLIRNSEKGLDSENDGFVAYSGKRNLLSWLIDCAVVKLGEKVHYMNRRRTRIMQEGWITRDGIHCACCSKILTVTKFEIHAGSKLRQPYQNICLASGESLVQCLVDAWNKQDESKRIGFNKIDVNGEDPDDDTCAICGDGGDLICCDSCPSTYHQNCLDIRMLPPGDWHCPHCSCKFCGLPDVSVDEEDDKRNSRIVSCSLCEGKFHSACVEEMDETVVTSDGPISLCGKKCQEAFQQLQKLLGVKHELEGGLCWSLIHRTDLDGDASAPGYPLRVEWNSKLAVALTVMDECFLPITDRRSGINMIHNVFYNCGSNFTRLNYSSFFTAVLERGDEIISAASIRLRGTKFAEMPFIGTREIYRRQGMCRQLFSSIESALCSLKVEKLIIPAIYELMDTWTTVFGFSTLEESDKREMKTLNLLAFPGTDMLQKKLVGSAKRDLAGTAPPEVSQSPLVMPNLRIKSESDAYPLPDNATALHNDDGVNDKNVAVSMGNISELGPSNVCSESKPSPHPSSDVAGEVNPLVPKEGDHSSAGSMLQSDRMLNDLPDEERASGSGDRNADIQEIGEVLDDSQAKHDLETSNDLRSTKDSKDYGLKSGSPPVDVSSAGSSGNVRFSSNDANQPSSETPDNFGVLEKPVLSPLHSTKVEPDCAQENHQGSGSYGSDSVSLVASTTTCIETSCGPSILNSEREDLSQTTVTATADELCISAQNSSDSVVGLKKPQLDSGAGDCSQSLVEDKLKDARDNSGEVTAAQLVSRFENADPTVAEKSQLDSCDAGGKPPILGEDVVCLHHTEFETVSAQPVSGSKNADTSVEEKPHLNLCDETLKKPVLENELDTVQAVNGSESTDDVVAENCELASCDEGGKQTLSEGEVRCANDISVETDGTQPVIRFESVVTEDKTVLDSCDGGSRHPIVEDDMVACPSEANVETDTAQPVSRSVNADINLEEKPQLDFYDETDKQPLLESELDTVQPVSGSESADVVANKCQLDCGDEGSKQTMSEVDDMVVCPSETNVKTDTAQPLGRSENAEINLEETPQLDFCDVADKQPALESELDTVQPVSGCESADVVENNCQLDCGDEGGEQTMSKVDDMVVCPSETNVKIDTAQLVSRSENAEINLEETPQLEFCDVADKQPVLEIELDTVQPDSESESADVVENNCQLDCGDEGGKQTMSKVDDMVVCLSEANVKTDTAQPVSRSENAEINLEEMPQLDLCDVADKQPVLESELDTVQPVSGSESADVVENNCQLDCGDEGGEQTMSKVDDMVVCPSEANVKTDTAQPVSQSENAEINLEEKPQLDFCDVGDKQLVLESELDTIQPVSGSKSGDVVENKCELDCGDEDGKQTMSEVEVVCGNDASVETDAQPVTRSESAVVSVEDKPLLVSCDGVRKHTAVEDDVVSPGETNAETDTAQPVSRTEKADTNVEDEPQLNLCDGTHTQPIFEDKLETVQPVIGSESADGDKQPSLKNEEVCPLDTGFGTDITQPGNGGEGSDTSVAGKLQLDFGDGGRKQPIPEDKVLLSHDINVDVYTAGDIEAEKSQVDSRNGGSEEPILGVEVVYANDSCDDANTARVSNFPCELPAQSVQNFKMEKPQPQACDGSDNQQISKRDVHHSSDCVAETANALQDSEFPGEPSSQNVTTVLLESKKLDLGDGNQPIPDGEVQHVDDVTGQSETAQQLHKSTCETPVEVVDASSHSEENAPTLCSDQSAAETVVVPVSSLDDKDTM